MPKRHRKMKKGGLLGLGESDSGDSGSSMFGSIGSTLSGLGSSISDSASSAWNKTKSATSSAYDSVTGSTGTTGDYGSYTGVTPSYNNTSPYGGRRKKSRKMRGGFKDNTPTTGLAAHASPISDIKSAQPHNWVGGKTRKRARKGGKHRHSKS